MKYATGLLKIVLRNVSVAGLLAFGLFVPPSITYAVPAAPIEFALTQPDGHRFKARQWGDEWSHGWETVEGYTILKERATGRWVYARRDVEGRLESSGHVVGVHAPVQGTPRHLRPRPQQINSTDSTSAVAATGPQPGIALSGAAHVLTVLINFSDRTTTYSAANFESLLFGDNVNSMRDFYTQTSHGVFTVDSGSGVKGWYTAANGHDYYDDDIGGRVGLLVYEAMQAADNAGVDFSQYDQDGDCYVDVANIVHQGSGEEASGVVTDIWSHSWALSSAYQIYTTQSNCVRGGKIQVNRYVIQPETLWGSMSTMGVFAHEYGHALGLPDLYDYGSDSQGAGNWSLMAGGTWNGVSRAGDRPALMDAWARARLGWVMPTLVTSATSGSVTIEPAVTKSSVYQFRNGSATGATGEYFLVENRQKTGFDAALPGSGLLVWHIDEAVSGNNSQWYPGCTSCGNSHYKVALVQADNNWNLEKNNNRGDAGDPFPGTTGKVTFNDVTSPGSLLYNGATSGISISSIAQSSPNITATLAMNPTLAMLSISGANSVNENASAAYTAIATYSDGSTKTVTPTWTDNSDFAAIAAGGLLTTTEVTANQSVTVSASFVDGDITRTATKTVTIVNLVPVLTALAITGPGTVNEISQASYTATATFSDGSTLPNVAATWSENSPATTISGSGVLTAGSVKKDQSVTVSAKYTAGGITKSGAVSVKIVNK